MFLLWNCGLFGIWVLLVWGFVGVFDNRQEFLFVFVCISLILADSTYNHFQRCKISPFKALCVWWQFRPSHNTYNQVRIARAQETPDCQFGGQFLIYQRVTLSSSWFPNRGCDIGWRNVTLWLLWLCIYASYQTLAILCGLFSVKVFILTEENYGQKP